MSLFSGRRSIWREIRKKENISVAALMCDLSLVPPPCRLFLFRCFFLFGVFALSSLSLCHAWIWKTGNAEEFTSSLILAMGSWPENTSSNFCLYWSSCVFSACCSSHQCLQGFLPIILLCPSLLQDPQFSYFPCILDLKISYDLILDYTLTSTKCSSHGLIHARGKKKEEKASGRSK